MRKFSSVYCAGNPAVCGVRKLCQSKNTSGTRASQTTSATGAPISTHLASSRGATVGKGASRPTASLTASLHATTQTKRPPPQGPLPRLRGRDREGARGLDLIRPLPNPPPQAGEGADRVRGTQA